jgi:hypothetical protein
MSDGPVSGGLLSRDDILTAVGQSEVETRDIAVPEFNGRMVRVREMSGAMRSRLEAAFASVRSSGDARPLEKVTAQMLAACVVGESNRPILREADAKRIFDQNPKAAYRLREAIFEISAIDDEDLEALAEGFGNGQSDDSISG